MYAKKDIQFKEQYPHEKNILYTDLQLNTDCAGVVIYLMLKCKTIKKEFLKRALVNIYKNYLKTYINREADGWFDYHRERMKSLIIEIHLINYCLNHGSLKKIIKHLSDNINTADILAGDVDANRHSAKVMKYINTHKKDFADNLFMSKTKNCNRFDVDHPLQNLPDIFPKPDQCPQLDPNIPYLGTVMRGGDMYFVNREENGNRIWVKYDPDFSFSYNYLNDDFLSSIYGKH